MFFEIILLKVFSFKTTSIRVIECKSENALVSKIFLWGPLNIKKYISRKRIKCNKPHSIVYMYDVNENCELNGK